MKYSIPILFLILVLFVSPFANSQDVRINEIVSANSSGLLDSYGDYSDWIEIKNYSNEAVNLTGYFLSDNADNPLKWSFPEVTLNANAYLIVYASEKDGTDEELHANFKLSKDGEVLLLSNNLGVLIDQYDSVMMKTDISYGRTSDNSDRLAFFAQPTPGSINNTTAYDGVLETASLSHESGFYPEAIQVTASYDPSVSVRYTLDGSEPNQYSALYNSGWLFENIENQGNVVSMIPTNPSFDYPKPDYDEARANSRGWLEPFSTVNKTNILKIKSFKSGYLSSETVAATYFIDADTSSQYNLPVISLMSEPDGFFSDESGIYVYGTTGAEGNYNEHGAEWERLTLMQYFENNGEMAFEQKLGTRIHGGGGRNSTIKNMRMYARDEYGKSSLEYPFFSYSNIEEFKRFMVRGPGHRPDCAPRDDLADLLIQNLDMDIQHVQPVIVFLNGEYWGIHTIKERFDQKYLELKYGKDDNDYVILRNSGVLDSGDEGDELPYRELLAFVSTEDMEEDENYEYVKTQIDIDNYLNYFTSEVFMGNVDWVNTNIKFWRYKGLDKSRTSVNGLDGKWRWFMYDFDLVFGSSCRDISPNVNVLDNAFDPEYGNATKLAIGLKDNEQFVHDFVNRMCDRFNSNFSKKYFLEQLEQIDSMLTPHMYEHVERWRYPSIAEDLASRETEIPTLAQWNMVIDELEDYTNNRKRKVIDHMTDEFDLEDSINVRLDVNDMEMGNIQVNSLLISEYTDGVNASVYPWYGTYFEDVPFLVMAIPKLGYRFVNWEETGSESDTLLLDLDEGIELTAIFEEDPDFVFDDALYINEFMASNNSIVANEFGAYADWIEIFNPNNVAVDLAAFYISDDKSKPYKYQFERGDQSTIIPAYGYKLIWCDDRTERGVLHTSFKLDAKGEDIVLTAPDSSLIDELTYAEQTTDVSFGRDKDGDETWVYFQKPIGPTPGATNNNAAIGELEDLSYLIYPNPVKQGQKVYLKHKMNIRIYDVLGKLVQQESDVYSIQTAHLSPGLYVVDLEDIGNIKLMVD